MYPPRCSPPSRPVGYQYDAIGGQTTSHGYDTLGNLRAMTLPKDPLLTNLIDPRGTDYVDSKLYDGTGGIEIK